MKHLGYTLMGNERMDVTRSHPGVGGQPLLVSVICLKYEKQPLHFKSDELQLRTV